MLIDEIQEVAFLRKSNKCFSNFSNANLLSSELANYML